MFAGLMRVLANLWRIIKVYFHMLVDDDWMWEMERGSPPRRKRPPPRRGPTQEDEDIEPQNRDERRATLFHPHTFAQERRFPERGYSRSDASRFQHTASARSRTLDPTRPGTRTRGRT